MKINLSTIKNSVNSIGNGLTIAGMIATVFSDIIPLYTTFSVIAVGIFLIIVSSVEGGYK